MAASRSTPVLAVIFDMDGLMVDTEPAYHASWQQSARELGYELDDRLYARFVGRPTSACETILVEELGAAFPLDRFRERWPVLWREAVARGVVRKPGLDAVLALVDEYQLRTAIATSTDAELAAFTLRHAGLAQRFDIVVSGDQVASGKPEPDIYLETARRLGVSPVDCVALEDSEAGIRAVAAAGMTGILVPHWPASTAAARIAFRVVDTLDEARAVLVQMLVSGRNG